MYLYLPWHSIHSNLQVSSQPSAYPRGLYWTWPYHSSVWAHVTRISRWMAISEKKFNESKYCLEGCLWCNVFYVTVWLESFQAPWRHSNANEHLTRSCSRTSLPTLNWGRTGPSPSPWCEKVSMLTCSGIDNHACIYSYPLAAPICYYRRLVTLGLLAPYQVLHNQGALSWLTCSVGRRGTLPLNFYRGNWAQRWTFLLLGWYVSWCIIGCVCRYKQRSLFIGYSGGILWTEGTCFQKR